MTKSYLKVVVSTSTATVNIPFPYFDKSNISVTPPAEWAGTFVVNDTLHRVEFTPALTTGTLLIRRSTPDVLRHLFANLMRFNFTAVDDAFTQVLYWFQETRDSLDFLDASAILGRVVAVEATLAGLLSSTGASLLYFIQGGLGAVSRSVSEALTSTVTPAQFGAKGDGTTNDWAAIKASIAAAVASGKVLDLEGRTYLLDSTESKLAYEVVPPCIRLPNSPLTIVGRGAVLKQGTGITALALLQTTYGSTAKIRVSGVSIQGTGNSGGSNYALIDGLAIAGGTQNASFALELIDGTKRHGVYIVDGAQHNTVEVQQISSTCREMLGCGVQIEGASHNTVRINTLINIGSNGLDINEFVAGGYYPTGGGSPYSPTNSSVGNQVFLFSIQGTGVNAGAVTYNPDDDYYGINVIGASSSGNYVEVGAISDVRTSNGTIAPALSTGASAIRLMSCSGTVVKVGNVLGVGPSDSGYVAKVEACINCTVQVLDATRYAAPIYTPVPAGTAGNRVLIGRVSGRFSETSVLGMAFRWLQQATCTTSLAGVISGWQGAFGHTYSAAGGVLSITVDSSTYKVIQKDLVFTHPYVMLDFEYNMSNTAGANPTAGLVEAPYTALALIKDGAWHSASVIIPYTDGTQTVGFGPNNGGTPAPGAVLQLRNVRVVTPDGVSHTDPELEGSLNGAPTVGTHVSGERVRNATPATGTPKGWDCSAGGTPGTWLSLGNY